MENKLQTENAVLQQTVNQGKQQRQQLEQQMNDNKNEYEEAIDNMKKSQTQQ